MMSPAELWYRAKKIYAVYPGLTAPVSADFLADHYARRRQGRSGPRALLDMLVGAAFLAWVPHRAANVQRRFGFDEAWRIRAIEIARARFVDPSDIALFRIERADELDGYIRRFEDAGLNKIINPCGWRRDCALADKIRFYRRCAERGLPHPQVFATWENGKLRVQRPVGAQPLLLKPARGEGGRGVRFLDLHSNTPASLRSACHGLRGAWLVQQRIMTHPALHDLALNALPTARMTTILDEHGKPELVNAVLRIPSDPTAQVDNMKAGGLLSPVDLSVGTLGVGCAGYGGSDHVVHPVSGATIPGRVLPDWNAAKDLVILAHSTAFHDYALIGWDVGFSPDGPVLVEGNGKPGVLMPQRAGRRGLGSQRYGELLRLQLARTASQRRNKRVAVIS